MLRVVLDDEPEQPFHRVWVLLDMRQVMQDRMSRGILLSPVPTLDDKEHFVQSDAVGSMPLGFSDGGSVGGEDERETLEPIRRDFRQKLA